MSDLLNDWNEDLTDWEYVPGLDEDEAESYDPDGYSFKEIDFRISEHFGQEPVAAQPPAQKENLHKAGKPATMQVQTKRVTKKVTPEKEKRTMTASNGVRVRKPKAGQEVTPFGRRGRPSQEMKALRVAELEAGYLMPVVNHNPEGQRGRPRLFARISVADLARANAALEAAGEALIEA